MGALSKREPSRKKQRESITKPYGKSGLANKGHYEREYNQQYFLAFHNVVVLFFLALKNAFFREIDENFYYPCWWCRSSLETLSISRDFTRLMLLWRWEVFSQHYRHQRDLKSTEKCNFGEEVTFCLYVHRDFYLLERPWGGSGKI